MKIYGLQKTKNKNYRKNEIFKFSVTFYNREANFFKFICSKITLNKLDCVQFIVSIYTLIMATTNTVLVGYTVVTGSNKGIQNINVSVGQVCLTSPTLIGASFRNNKSL